MKQMVNSVYKKCSKCLVIKPITFFGSSKQVKSGIYSSCKECEHKRGREYRSKNIEKLRVIWAEHRKRDRVTLNLKSRDRYRKNPEYNKNWNKQNPDKCRAYKLRSDRKRMLSHENRLHNSMGTAIYTSLKGCKNGRSWELVVGYSLQDLITHLQQFFTSDMTWENYGKYWHIDHIRPKSSFKFDTDKDTDFVECWSLSNLQPLEAIENIKKGSKLNYATRS